MTIIHSRSGRLAATLGATALLAASLLTACAPSAPESENSADPKSGASNSTYEQDYADWQRKFYACLRAEGIDVKDPAPNEMPTMDNSNPAVIAALDACSDKGGPAPINPDGPTDEEINAQQLIFAKCMRDAGYEWEDPEPIGGGADSEAVEPLDPNEYAAEDLDRCELEAGYTDTGSGR